MTATLTAVRSAWSTRQAWCDATDAEEPQFSASACPCPVACAAADEVWVQLKARTTDKTTRAVVEHRWAVRASKAGVTLGSDAATAGIAIADSAVSAGNARLLLTAAGEVAVEPQGRVYSMVGQRAGEDQTKARLHDASAAGKRCAASASQHELV